jgi:hypothetical protein
MPITQLDAKIWTALRTRLATMPGGYAIVDPGQTYPASADTAFILLQDVRFDPATPYIGGNDPAEYRGQLALLVMTPLSWTHSQSLGIVGLIRAHFPIGAKYASGDARVEILQTPSAGTAYRDGAWNRVPVAVRWRAAG